MNGVMEVLLLTRIMPGKNRMTGKARRTAWKCGNGTRNGTTISAVEKTLSCARNIIVRLSSLR